MRIDTRNTQASRLCTDEVSPPLAKRISRLASQSQFAKVENQMPVPTPLGPHYTKSLRLLLKGPLGIHERKDVVRYKALQGMGLVDGVGVRCVSLTKAGREVLRTGNPAPQDSLEEFPF